MVEMKEVSLQSLVLSDPYPDGLHIQAPYIKQSGCN